MVFTPKKETFLLQLLCVEKPKSGSFSASQWLRAPHTSLSVATLTTYTQLSRHPPSHSLVSNHPNKALNLVKAHIKSSRQANQALHLTTPVTSGLEDVPSDQERGLSLAPSRVLFLTRSLEGWSPASPKDSTLPVHTV